MGREGYRVVALIAEKYMAGAALAKAGDLFGWKRNRRRGKLG